MGDLGNSSSTGGLSLGGSDLNSLFGDASGATSSADLSSLFADAGLSSALLGDSSGLGGVFNTATDPSGAAAASLSTTPPADASGTPSGADPSGNVGGTQSGGAPQPNAPQPQPQPQTQKQPASPLAQIARTLGAAFGLGQKPTAGGPTGPTPAQAGADQPGGGGILSQFLPTMPTPANTGTLPYGGYSARPGTGGIGSDAAASGDEGGPADTSTPTTQPNIPIGGGPGMTMEGPTGTPAQPTVAARTPIGGGAGNVLEAPTGAPAPASADLPTRKEPAAPEAAPGPSVGPGGPTAGAGGMPEILRDILGLALGSPTLLPMLAQMMMGGRGRGRGGIPPWAMHGMAPFMRGRDRGFGGFRGGFLRPGYYPRRQGGWGFHPGGYHPGWGAWAPGQMGNQPMAFVGGGGSSGGGGASGGWNAPTTDGSPSNGGQAGASAAQPNGATQPVDGVPPDVLNEARQVALQTGGDPNAVADFMRQQGYPQHAGEWCGDFVAAVTHAAGMVPPPGSAMASAWARFGSPRQGGPQPGDIAVIRGYDARTGSNYTHVTIVDRVNPDGTFVGLGGNQRGGQLTRSVFSTAGADFRVPPPNAPATASAPSTPPAATPPAAAPQPAQPAPVQSDDFATTG